MEGWLSRWDHSTGWSPCLHSPVYLNDTRYWRWLCGIASGKILVYKNKWKQQHEALDVYESSLAHCVDEYLPTLLHHIHLHAFVLHKNREPINTCINYCSLVNHKTLWCTTTSSDVQRREQTGRRPRASKAGGHTKSEITKIKML